MTIKILLLHTLNINNMDRKDPQYILVIVTTNKPTVFTMEFNYRKNLNISILVAICMSCTIIKSEFLFDV